jgi:hypothetical protein
MIKLIAGILLLTFALTVLAGHNPSTGKDRGYNQKNCLNMTSKVTGKQAEWLGHIVGCMVEDKSKEGNLAYVLIQEYEVTFLTEADGIELRGIAEKYSVPELEWKEPEVNWEDGI